MLLGQWHGLSDTQLEHALKVRLDFMVFTGFEPGDGSFPDATTICRFRNRLVTAKLDQVLLRRVNVQLEGQGLKVAGSRGAIIDATIIESAARPNQHVEVDDEGQADVVDSADEEHAGSRRAMRPSSVTAATAPWTPRTAMSNTSKCTRPTSPR
nr:transposase [Pelomonas sp. P8]